jgi:hypothetical protein
MDLYENIHEWRNVICVGLQPAIPVDRRPVAAGGGGDERTSPRRRWRYADYTKKI